MNEKFFDLSREKQDRMINGALEVFAKNGFKHASTDDMVKAVDVSKGLWFHYFGSKVGIYTFVYGYSVKYMLLELSTVVDADEKDFFEITKQVEFTKMRISKSYPYMTLFLDQAMKETDAEILEKIRADKEILLEKMTGMFKSGEIAQVGEKALRERIKKMVRYTIDGIVRDKASVYAPDHEAIYREIRNYLDMIRNMLNGMQGSSQNQTEEEKTTGMLETVAS